MRQILFPQEATALASNATPHIIGESPDVLREILDSGVNLCLWRRPVKAAIAQELSSLQAADLPDVRCTTSPNSFDDDVSKLLQRQHLDPLAFQHWRNDMRQLANLYFTVSGNRDVTLRLVTTQDDDCRRFHVDRTHLRLLCTYQGPGTEWLTNDQADRSVQNSGASNADIIRFGEPCRFETFWAGILKGDVYPGNAGYGLIHRSPPIAGSGKSRVLFCLDC